MPISIGIGYGYLAHAFWLVPYEGLCYQGLPKARSLLPSTALPCKATLLGPSVITHGGESVAARMLAC